MGVVLASTSACSDSIADPGDIADFITGDAIAGSQAFVAECGTCHASRDGFDLAFFAFPDSTIVRRALGHVDLDASHDIVAYIRTLQSEKTTRSFRLFQPNGRRLPTDAQFAEGVFGADAWPADWNTAQLLAVDPLDVTISIDLPLWSLEGSNRDWMPETMIQPELLDYVGETGPARGHLERYYAQPDLPNLYHAVLALRIAEQDPANTLAPCVVNHDAGSDRHARFQPAACFEARRWISSLVAQHMLREGITEPIHNLLHDAWWDAGMAARRSRVMRQPIENATENWVAWMYMGWAFEPDRHASIYLASGLADVGLPRHAAFHTLRVQVARSVRSVQAFEDVLTLAQVVPAHWAVDATIFSYRNLIERLDVGYLPRNAMDAERARHSVERAYDVLLRRRILDVASVATLVSMRNEILSRLPHD